MSITRTMHWGSSDTTYGKRLAKGPDAGTASRWGKVFHTVTSLADIGYYLLWARGKLRLIDYAAIGAKTVQAGMNIYSTWTPEKTRDLTPFFEHQGSEWKVCSPYVASLAFEGQDIRAEMHEDYQVVYNRQVQSAVWTAEHDGVKIGWISAPELTDVPDHMWSPTPEKLRDLAAERLWEEAGSDQIVRIQGERPVPHYLPTAIVETEFLKRLEDRVRKFLGAGVPRAFIMDGEPGTGKTTAAGHIAKKLGFRTVVMNADDFVKREGMGSQAKGAQLAEILKPAVLVVNDIDRVGPADQIRLLDLLDNAKGYAKLIFATTNHYRRLIEPVRRPGRLDDLIHVPGLSITEIETLTPELLAVAPRMVGWPIAYVADMADRHKVLGYLAFSEMDDIEKRLEEVRQDGQYQLEADLKNAAAPFADLADDLSIDDLFIEEMDPALMNESGWPSP